MNITKLQNNRLYNIIIRGAIIFATYYFVYKQVLKHIFDQQSDEQSKIDIVVRLFSEMIDESTIYIYLSIVLLLMPVNWGFEAYKWQFLINKLEKIPFLKSFKAVYSGVSVSVFTPNRVGEWFGRIFILEKANPWESMFSTIIGSISQLFITLIIGTISTIIFVPIYFRDFFSSDYVLFGFIILALLFVVILVAIFINVRLVPSIIKQFIKKRFLKFYEYFSVIKNYSSYELAKVLLISLLRYSVFSFQFYLVLRMFSVEIPFFYGMVTISVFYFVMTAIPTVTLAELGIRGGVSVYVFSLYFEKYGVISDSLELGIMASSSVVWLVNLVLPAIIGTFFVNKLRFFRKSNNQK